MSINVPGQTGVRSPNSDIVESALHADVANLCAPFRLETATQPLELRQQRVWLQPLGANQTPSPRGNCEISALSSGRRNREGLRFTALKSHGELQHDLFRSIPNVI